MQGAGLPGSSTYTLVSDLRVKPQASPAGWKGGVGAKPTRPAPYPWSTTHFTDSWFSSMWGTWAVFAHTIPSRGLTCPNLAKQAALRRACVWKPNGGGGEGESLGFPQLLRPQVWAKYTHCTGPAQCELSISMGNKCHSGVTALYR